MSTLFARLKLNHLIVLLLLIFVALAFFYSIIIPIFEGPDEDDHFRYAKFIADQRAFPVQLFEPGGGVAGHQGWQPPLYYSLVALTISPIDTSDYEQQLWRNMASTFIGDPACCGRNLYYHPDAQNFPWSRTTLAVHLARLLSILFGVITILATYEIAKTLLQAQSVNSEQQSTTILAIVSVVAFNPSFLFTSALVSNDAPLAACSALALLLWVKLLAGAIAPTLRSATILGAVIGLGLLVKTTALGLILFSIFVLVIVAWRKCDARFAIGSNVAMLAMTVLISGWWFVRNTMLYGDPLAYRLITTSALFPRSGPLTPPELFQISLPWLWQTFWGGPTPGDFSPVLLGILGALGLLALGGIVIFLIRNSQFAIRSALLILGAWLGFILVAQIQFIQTTTGADQGRYLFPAISVTALFFVLGLDELTRQLGKRILNLEFRISNWFIIAFFLLAIFVPFAYTLPAYTRPALVAASNVNEIPHPLDASFGNQLQLLGYQVESRSVKPGDVLRVTLYWRALAPMSESYRVFVQLVGQDNRFAGSVDVIPGHGAFPTVYWKPGDTLRDEIGVPLAIDAMPGKYALQVGAYPVGKPNMRLVIANSDDTSIRIDSIKVAPRVSVAFTPSTRVNANFGDQIDLVGYDASIKQEELHLSLYWRARTSIDTDYTVFVQVFDANGERIAQVDRQPQNGIYPTSIWAPGEQLQDEYTLRVPTNSGATHIITGLYNGDTGERLPVLIAGSSSDHVEIKLGATQ